MYNLKPHEMSMQLSLISNSKDLVMDLMHDKTKGRNAYCGVSVICLLKKKKKSNVRPTLVVLSELVRF